jgi:hypothetical protein
VLHSASLTADPKDQDLRHPPKQRLYASLGPCVILVLVAGPIKLFILGLDHWIQRHQDVCPERVAARKLFENAIRQLVEKEGMRLVAEETGGKEVREKLQREEDLWAACLVRSPITIPSKTIVENIINEIRGCRYVDIRPPGKWVHPQQDAEYERQLINGTFAAIGDARQVLLLCGDVHRTNLSEHFKRCKWHVEEFVVREDGQFELT